VAAWTGAVVLEGNDDAVQLVLVAVQAVSPLSAAVLLARAWWLAARQTA
jgi:hypothetical protein